MGYDHEHAARIIIDLETAPIADAADYIAPSEAPVNYKDEDKIAEYIAHARQAKLDKAALDPDLCRIVALGVWAENDQPCVRIAQGESAEKLLLLTFWRVLGAAHFIGKNCLAFDLPVLLRRSLYLGVEAPAIQLDRFKHPQVTDLQAILSMNNPAWWHTLNFNCRRLGLDVPEDATTGADIPALVAGGEWDAVRAHCLADVIRTGKLAARLGLFKTEALAGDPRSET